MRANKATLRKRPDPTRKTRRGSTHKPTGYRKLIRGFLKEAGLWYSEGYPGHKGKHEND